MSATTTHAGFCIEEILRRGCAIVGVPTSTITPLCCIKRKQRYAHILAADDSDSKSAIYIKEMKSCLNTLF